MSTKYNSRSLGSQNLPDAQTPGMPSADDHNEDLAGTDGSETDEDPSETVLDRMEMDQGFICLVSQTRYERLSHLRGRPSKRSRHSKTPLRYDRGTPTPKRRRLSPRNLGAEIKFININLPFNYRGRFSDLYLGIHRTAGRVGLKRLRCRVTGEGQIEALDPTDIWMGLRHTHILQYLGTFEYIGHLYMRNGTLSDWIRYGDHGQAQRRLIAELTPGRIQVASVLDQARARLSPTQALHQSMALPPISRTGIFSHFHEPTVTANALFLSNFQFLLPAAARPLLFDHFPNFYAFSSVWRRP